MSTLRMARRVPQRPTSPPDSSGLVKGLVIAVVVALAVSAPAFFLMLAALDLPLPPTDPEQRRDVLNVTRLALGTAAGAGALVALVLAVLRQRIAEVASHRDEARRFNEEYVSASEQLGHEKAAVRLAGVLAITRLADDWPEHRSVCIDVFSARTSACPTWEQRRMARRQYEKRR
jgi:hypothetical protein